MTVQICFKSPNGRHFRYLHVPQWTMDPRCVTLQVFFRELRFLEREREDAFVSGTSKEKVIQLAWVTLYDWRATDKLVVDLICEDADFHRRNWEPFNYHGQPTAEEMALVEGVRHLPVCQVKEDLRGKQ